MLDEAGTFAFSTHAFSYSCFFGGSKKKSGVTKTALSSKETTLQNEETLETSQSIPSKRSISPEMEKDTPSLFRKKKTIEATLLEESPKAVPSSQELVTAFSQEELTSVWRKFATEKKEEGDLSIQLILKKKLIKGEGFQVIITLTSQLEISFLSKLELVIIQYLREHLKNQKITLKKELKEQEVVERLYTREDIYGQMIKDNPYLKELKEILGLDYNI